jgi:hypothetical protein
MKPVALFVPEDTEFGRVLHPANDIAKQFAAVAGVTRLPEDRIPYIRALGFEVAETNGQPLPIQHPWKGYRRQPEAKPKHIMDEA